MKKEFVPYELALELRRLGFDEPCFGFYERNQELIIQECLITDFHGDSLQCVAPTYSQAFRWFRENYDIHYSIDRECSQHDHKWGYNWSLYNYTGIFDEYLTSHPDAPAGEWVYETHEEAELACLRKLIETVKEK